MSERLDFEVVWKPYAELLSVPQMASAISGAVKFAAEAPLAVVPSIQLMPDGPKIVSLFVITDSYFMEVAPDGSTFDVIDRGRVLVMRWFFGAHTVQLGGKEPALYETATLRITHGPTGTEMHFVGPKREAWVKQVEAIFPASVVRRSRYRKGGLKSVK